MHSERYQTQKSNQCNFGMRAHIAVDVDGCLVHTVIGAAANVPAVTQASALLHGAEEVAIGEADYRGMAQRSKRTSQAEAIGPRPCAGRLTRRAWSMR